MMPGIEAVRRPVPNPEASLRIRTPGPAFAPLFRESYLRARSAPITPFFTPFSGCFMPASSETWHVYLALCRDGSLYCGIALSVARRIGQHNAGTGARYMVPSRRPVTCAWKRRAGARGEALRLEAWIKRQPTAVKRALT